MSHRSRRSFIQLSGAASLLGLAGVQAPAGRATASGSPGTPSNPGYSPLITATRQLLATLSSPELNSFLNDWPVSTAQREVAPSSLPVLRWLAAVRSSAPAFSTKVVTELCNLAPTMRWRQTYKQPDVSAAFLQNYGWAEIAGLTGPLPSSHLACGFLLLGPSTEYPRHRHEAQEVYVPLSGTASWQQGDGIWRERSPGAVIHHRSDEPHAMRTASQPMLAVYLWHATDLNQKSRLDPQV
jgi:quercetin dioxygenase-like cupin family protein